MGIFQGKLEEMYDNSEPAKLAKMMENSEKLEEQSRNLSGQASDIQKNIRSTIERRLKVASQEEQDKHFISQMEELAKQWQLMAASMCKVQRTVMADGFHSSIDLYVNKMYGFKEYKRFSGWNPFHYIRPSTIKGNDEASFEFKADQTMLFTQYGTQNSLNFKALYKIPQFDSAKVTELSNLTNDILRFMLSWKQFYAKADYSRMDDIKTLLNYGSYSSHNGPDFKKLVLKLPDLIAFKEGIVEKLGAQSALTQPIVDRWKEANKNFVVLNELAKKDLNI